MTPSSGDGKELGASVLGLPPMLDCAAAGPLCDSLRDRLGNAERIVVDGGVVERVSTACVQVLLAAASDARSRGVSFRLQHPSPALAAALVDLGIAPDFIA